MLIEIKWARTHHYNEEAEQLSNYGRATSG